MHYCINEGVNVCMFSVFRLPADSREMLRVWTPHHGDGAVFVFVPPLPNYRYSLNVVSVNNVINAHILACAHAHAHKRTRTPSVCFHYDVSFSFLKVAGN